MLTLPVYLGARKRKSVLSACTCACVWAVQVTATDNAIKKKKNGVVTRGQQPPRASVVSDVCCRAQTWMVPISTGKMHVSFCILYPPQLEFAFSVVDFSLRMSSSLAQGFLKCLSAVLSIHTGILEHSRYVYSAAVLPGSTNLRKLCCKMFKTLTNIRSFFRELDVFV